MDTGAGNGKSRPLTPFPHQLSGPNLKRCGAIGVQLPGVDFVQITPLQVVHNDWGTIRSGGGECRPSRTVSASFPRWNITSALTNCI